MRAIALLILLIASLCDAASARAAKRVDFAHEVLPLLLKHCAKCHTAGRNEGDVSFDTRETLVVVASEFSRDMMIEGVPGSEARDQSWAKSDVLLEAKHYGLHRLSPAGRACCCLAAA